MTMNPQAQELNDLIRNVNPHVYDLLSERGRNIFFPKKGILGQTAEADGCEINATIGTALEDDGSIMCLNSIAKNVSLDPKDVFPYAKSYGRPDIRKVWKEHLLKKNPLLENKAISLPVVSSALTHGLSMGGFLLCNEGDRIILPELFWGNYRLIFCHGWGAQLSSYPTFVNNKSFNVDGLREKLIEGAPGKRIVLLNSPNNPTGYTPTVEEAHRIREVLVEAAEAGNTLAVLIDDAYFGLVYENGIFPESLFGLLADAHERILAVKFDGPTKEDYVWGFRVGFVTFGTKKNSPEFYSALESKIAGQIRGNISNSSHLGQSLLLRAYSDPDYVKEKKQKYDILKKRYQRINEVFNTHPEYSEVFEPLPFNSGYFMCIKPFVSDVEALRKKLLEKYSTGLIVVGDILRIAFSSTPYEKLDTLFANIYNAGKELQD
ncbi:MAG: aminotransferase class I/II-fold pyridoxal phosphate-dependent enzyme [Chitinivibrionales bacterium]|nr:aminotransferase class I/II-fold pyridoxal phosphate-dependent enzyme [Chitinivibrionales bacterium]